MGEELYGGGGGGGILNIAAGTNITISSSAGSYTINGGVNTGATTFLAGIVNSGNTSNTTGVVNNQLVLVGGNNITLSENLNANSATVLISAPNYSQSFGASNLGNTAGTSGIASGSKVQFLFQGGNNITLSQSVNGASGTITIVGPTTSAQQTGISGIAGSNASTATAGTVQFQNSNGVTFGLAGNTITASVSQSVQPEGTIKFGISTAGNTAGTTGLATGTGPQLLLVGGDNITLSQSVDAGGASATVTIIGASGGGTGGAGAQMTLGGNSTSAGAGYILISSGTATLAGGNNITLSQDGNHVTIIGGAGGSGVQGIAASNASTVTGGTIQFANSNDITFGLNGSTITASAAKTWNVVSAGGNTSGTMTSFSTGTIVFMGGNNITLSQSSNSITISAPSGGGAGVSSGGNTGGTTGTIDARLIFVGSNNITLSQSVSSDSATISIYGASGGGAGGANIGFTATGNTAGTNFSASTGTIYFQGTNNITVSGATNTGSVSTLWISGPSGGGAGMGTASAGTSGTTGSVGAQLYFYPGSNISLSQSVDAGSKSASLTIIGAGASGSQSTQTYNVVSASGNTAGTLSSQSTGTMVFAGGANITLSQSSNTITIVGGAGGGGVAAGMTNTGNSAGTAFSSTTGTVFFQGTNNITVSASTGGASVNTIWISGPTGGGAGMGTGTNTSGTSGSVGAQLYFYGNSNIGLSQSTNGVSGSLTIIGNAGGGGLAIAGSNASTKTAGTLNFAASNGITFGMSSDSMTASYSATAATNVFGMSNLGNTQGTTGVVSANQVQVYFAGGNNITLNQSINGVSETITVNGPDPAQFQIGASNLGNTAGTSGVASGSKVYYFFDGGANITLSQSVNGSSGTVTIIGAAGGAGGAAIGVTNTGNTSGTNFTTATGTVYFQGTNNITVSNSSAAGSLQTLWISGPSGGGAGMGSGATGTSGTSGTAGQQLYLYPGNNLVLSQSLSAVSLLASLTLNNLLSSSGIAQIVSNVSSAGTQTANFAMADHAHLGVGGIVPSATASTFVGNVILSAGTNMSLASAGNSSAGTILIHGIGAGSATAITGKALITLNTAGLSFNGTSLAGTGTSVASTTGNYSLALNSTGLTLSVPYRTRVIFPSHLATAVGSPTNASASFQYVNVQAPVTATRLDFLVGMSLGSAATTATGALVYSAYGVIYTRNVSSLSSLSSGSTQTTWTYASNTGGQTQLTQSAVRAISIPINVNMAPGEYIVGINFITNGTSSIGASTTNYGATMSMWGAGGVETDVPYAEMANATNTSSGLAVVGVYNAASTGLPVSVSIANINQTGSAIVAGNIALIFRNA